MLLTSRHLKSIFLLSLTFAFASFVVADPAPKIRILGIGNSFTMNSTRYLNQIIDSDPDVSADVGVAYIGGCSLDQHVSFFKIHEQDPEDPKGKKYAYRLNRKTAKAKASLKEILLDGPWDYITIQQVSHKSYKPESYYPYAKELYDYARKYAPDAKIAIHETWPHRIDCPRTKQWNLLPDAMYEKLHANYAKVAGELGIPVIPVGTAFQEAKKNPLWQYEPPKDFDPKTMEHPKLPDQSKSLHSGWRWRKDKKDETKRVLHIDGFHAGSAGEYLGGLVWYEFFFHKDSRNVAYRPKHFSEEQAKSLQDAAHQAMASTTP